MTLRQPECSFKVCLLSPTTIKTQDPRSCDPSNSNMSLLGEPLFDEVASSGTSARVAQHSMVTLDVLADFLNFSFGGKPYEQQVRATWPDSDRLVSVR